jgi:hypothetical protein
MTAVQTEGEEKVGCWIRLQQVYHAHRDFILLLALFAVLQLMLLAFFAPGGYFGDYSDYWYYEEMASRLDSGYYPYLHYWVEYPPLFPWLPVGTYWLSRLLPPAPEPHLWFYVSFGSVMGLFAVGNLVMVYVLGLQLYSRSRALRCAWFYALLFGPIFVHAGWFDSVPLLFMLLSLYLLLNNRAALSGLAAGVGVMIKILPLALVPVGFKLLSRRWRYVLAVVSVSIAVNLPFYLLNPAMFIASWRSLLTTPSWETVWALLDGYYSYGLALGNRFDPVQAGMGQRPEFVPSSAVFVVFGIVYAIIYLLPWQQHQPGRPHAARRNWLRLALDQFRNPIMDSGPEAVNGVSVVAFVGLSLNLFMIFSRGYSPQFVLWYLPFLVLALPNGWGLAYATLLTIDSVVERIFYFFLLPESKWLLIGTVLIRTVLMLILVPEYLAVMGFLPLPRWRKVRRWASLPAAVVMLVIMGLGIGLFVRDYGQQRYIESTQRHVVDRIRAAAVPGDGVVITSREAFDAVAPFLADQGIRLYTRDEGEFRSAAFEVGWLEFVALHPRIWLLLDYAGGQNADWNAHLVQLLSQLGYGTSDEWVGPEQRLLHFAVTEPATTRGKDLDAVFGDEVRLLSVRLDGEPLHGGEVLRLELHWQELGEVDAERKVFLHLVSGQGEIRAQRDIALQDLRIQDAGGEAGRVGLLLPLDLEPGFYRLRIGFYDPATGARLFLPTGEDDLDVGEIEVQ